MELVLFIGIQATGKSTFYLQRFFRTHVRINLDMLKTRRRETLLVDACLEGKTPFVVDKMNLTVEDRAAYISPAKAAGFKVHGYFFQSQLSPALERNAQRDKEQRVPAAGLRSASSRLELPTMKEAFDQLFFVKMNGQASFTVEDWKHEV